MSIFDRSRFAVPSLFALITLLAYPTVARAGPAVAAGTPPLTPKMIEEVASLYASVLAVPLTEQQHDELQRTVADAWRSKHRPTTDHVLRLLDVTAQVAKRTEAQRVATWHQTRALVLDDPRSARSCITSWAQRVYSSAYKPVVAGNPPLTRQVTDAYAELLVFMMGQVRLGVAATPTPADRANIARAVADRYAHETAEERQRLWSIPAQWAELRRTWPMLSPAQHARLRRQWAKQLRLSAPGERSPAPAARDSVDDDSEAFAEESAGMMQDRLNNQNLWNAIGQQHSSVFGR